MITKEWQEMQTAVLFEWKCTRRSETSVNIFFQVIFNVFTTSVGKGGGKKIFLYKFGGQIVLTVSFHVLLLPWLDGGKGKIFWHLVLINLLQFSHGHSTL